MAETGAKFSKGLRANIPNFLTLCNLLSGALGIIYLTKHLPLCAAQCILVGAFFDLLDGLAARLLKSQSAIGKELDSLADMTTFGVLPALLVFEFMSQSLLHAHVISGAFLLPYCALLIAVGTAIRLARFNLETGDTSYFQGLPSPANALIVASFPFIVLAYPLSAPLYMGNTWFLLGFTFLSCLMLVSRIKLITLKFKGLSWKGNEGRFLFMAGTVLSILIFKLASIGFIIFLYFLCSYLQVQWQGDGSAIDAPAASKQKNSKDPTTGSISNQSTE